MGNTERRRRPVSSCDGDAKLSTGVVRYSSMLNNGLLPIGLAFSRILICAYLYIFFCQAIWLRVLGAWCYMFKVPSFGKRCKFIRRKLGAVVADYFFRNVMSGKMNRLTGNNPLLDVFRDWCACWQGDEVASSSSFFWERIDEAFSNCFSFCDLVNYFAHLANALVWASSKSNWCSLPSKLLDLQWTGLRM